MGAQIYIVNDENRIMPELSEVERLFAATDKARRLLEWSPMFAGPEGFEKGLAQTVEWFRDPANLARYKPNEYNL